MDISAACLSQSASSSILHSPFSDQSHLQFYHRSIPFSPSNLCSTSPCLSLSSKPSMSPFRALTSDAGTEPALHHALMKELADLKLQMKQKKMELKAHMKDDKKKLKVEMKEGKKMKKQKDASEGKMKMKKCSVDSSSSSSESSDGECESVSMKMLRQEQGVNGVSRFNGEEELECKDCLEICAGLPSRVRASCEDDAIVGCGGSSSNLCTLGHGIMEGFMEKSSRVSDSNSEIPSAWASMGSFDSHVELTSKAIPGKSRPSTSSRALFSSQLDSVQSSNRIEVCVGGKCKKAGSEQVLSAIRGHIPGSANVEAVPCKCMGKCSMAINVRVHKEDTNPQHHSLVAGVDDANLILNHHFGLGRPSTGLPSLPLNEGIRVPSPLAVV